MASRIRIDCSGRTDEEILRRLGEELDRSGAVPRVVLTIDHPRKVKGSLSRLLQKLLLLFHERQQKASVIDPSGCAQTLYDVLGGSVHVEVCRNESEISRPLHVAVIEDTPDNLAFLADLLESAGHTVTPLRSAQEALQACAGGAFDVLLIDLVLPDMDGVSLARELRETGIPMIAMSAYVDRWQDADFRAAGFRSRLRKPFKSLELLKALQA